MRSVYIPKTKYTPQNGIESVAVWGAPLGSHLVEDFKCSMEVLLALPAVGLDEEVVGDDIGLAS